MPIDPTTPIASAPADRLTLQTAVVRGADAAPSVSVPGQCYLVCNCFADEAAPASAPPGMCFVMCGCFADEA